MREIVRGYKPDYFLLTTILLLVVFSVLMLNSIASSLFPVYYLYIVLAIAAFVIFLQIDFEVLSVFSNHMYIGSIMFLILPLIIGQVTRGAIRWIPIGPLSIQPSEIVRPFLIVFFASYLAKDEITAKKLIKTAVLLLLPTFLILIQPSLGVAILTVVGFIGVLFALSFKKKYLLFAVIAFLILSPAIWGILAPYQKARLTTFLKPSLDPTGAGYNSIQSMIAVGSGKLLGRGLGKGSQAQLAFLPEKHTDFIFASIAEELGFVGSFLTLAGLMFILWRLTYIIDNAQNPAARAYVSGLFLVLFVQIIVHIGMNMGLLPITGVPLPLVSAGGSSLLATVISLAIAQRTKKVAST